MIKRNFSPLVLVVSIGLAIVLLGAIFTIIWSSLPQGETQPMPTPAMTVIPAPTATLPPTVSPILFTPSATSTLTVGDSGGEIQVGMYVQITGTGGDGLRLRAGPGTDNEPIFLGREAEVFLVKDGPKEGSGYTWFFLEAPYDTTRSGWAVANYLQVIASIEP